ncbi:MAG: hypothetical protein E6K97_08965 [Thaumarchaeota archaeon]|nr:MAG: hypothetical protein E6K97_08965 [Nitrososphaerota archaeon]
MKLYTEIISIGTAKLISKIINDNPEKLARHISKEYDFGLAFSSIMDSVQHKMATDRLLNTISEVKCPNLLGECGANSSHFYLLLSTG